MKKNIHPNYRQVLFIDAAAGYKFLCGSTLQTDATEKFEGKEYPVCYVSVSSASHPYYTGSKQFMDTEGRVDKFKKRYSKPPVQEKKEDEPSSQKDSKKEAKPQADSKTKSKKTK